MQQVQHIQEAFEREGTNGWCHMASNSQLLDLQNNLQSPPLLCDQSPMIEAGRTKAKGATSWADTTTAAVGEERLQIKFVNSYEK